MKPGLNQTRIFRFGFFLGFRGLCCTHYQHTQRGVKKFRKTFAAASTAKLHQHCCCCYSAPVKTLHMSCCCCCFSKKLFGSFARESFASTENKWLSDANQFYIKHTRKGKYVSLFCYLSSCIEFNTLQPEYAYHTFTIHMMIFTQIQAENMDFSLHL